MEIELLISRLSYETHEKLSNSLEKQTRNWEELMKSKTFGYSAEDIETIRRKGGSHPAKTLIDDLILCRKATVQELLSGLREISNEKAILIVKRELSMSRSGFSTEDFGGRPPPSQSMAREPEEHSMTSSSCNPFMEQTETLAYPIQEEINKENPRFHWYMGMFLLPCLYQMDSSKERNI